MNADTALALLQAAAAEIEEESEVCLPIFMSNLNIKYTKKNY